MGAASGGIGDEHQQQDKQSQGATDSGKKKEEKEKDNEVYGEDNYFMLYLKRIRTVDNDDLVRSGKYRVSGWNADGSERLVPIAPDNVSWVAWDAIRNEQAERRRQLQGIEVNEGRAATRARFGDG